MSTMQKLVDAYEVWERASNEAASVETGIEAIDEVVRCARGLDGSERVVGAADILRAAYLMNGDYNGVAANRFVQAMGAFLDERDRREG